MFMEVFDLLPTPRDLRNCFPNLTYMETYLASEGFIAYQSRPDTSSMQLVLDNGIFYNLFPLLRKILMKTAI